MAIERNVKQASMQAIASKAIYKRSLTIEFKRIFRFDDSPAVLQHLRSRHQHDERDAEAKGSQDAQPRQRARSDRAIQAQRDQDEAQRNRRCELQA